MSFLVIPVEETVEDGCLLLAEFLFHVKKCIIVFVFGILTVFIFEGGVFIELIVDEIVG